MKVRDLLANAEQLKSALNRIIPLSVALSKSSTLPSALTPDNGSTMARQWLHNGSTKFHKNLGRLAVVMCLLMVIGLENAWGETILEGFESKAAGTNYQSTITISTLESDCGLGWEFYYGTVSIQEKIHDSNSAALRLYSSSSNFGYLKTTIPINGLKRVSFLAKAQTSKGAAIKIDIHYSTNGGSTWSPMKMTSASGSDYTNQALTTSATAYTAFVPTGITGDILVKFSINSSSTKPSSGNAQLTIDNVAFFTTAIARYALVTNASSLVSGDEIIILNSTGTKAISTTQNPNNRGASTDFSLSSNTVTLTGSTVETFTLGTGNSYWTLYSSSGYIYAPSSTNNYLRTRLSNTDGDSEWDISISSNIASITAKGEHTRNQLKNNGDLFSCYSSGQTTLKIFKKVIPSSSCSMSGNIYVTSTQNRGIMAVTPLSISASGLTAGIRTLTLTSNSSDVYFSADRNANFAKSAPNIPTNSLVLLANSSGEISTTNVYVHYKPSSVGTGTASDVTITATPSNGDAVTHTIHVRNLPNQFVIASKVGNTWYALPADFSSVSTTPDAIVIDVNEATMTATAPNTCYYTLWPVKTAANATDRYALQGGNAYGGHVRPVTINNSKGLWASTNSTGIRNTVTINSLNSGAGSSEESYEWKITTTVTSNNWHYTLQSNQAGQSSRYLSLHNGQAASSAFVWGTYTSSAFETNDLYFLPVIEKSPFTLKAVEWYPTKVLVYSTSNLTSLSPSVTIGGNAVASPTFTAKGTNLYEIGGLDLTNVSNAAKTMTISYTASTVNYAASIKVPIIISITDNSVANPEGAKEDGLRPLNTPFSTITPDVYNYADLVVRDGATLTVNGSQIQNTFYDITIYPNSKISVPATNTNNSGDNNYLSCHSLTFFGGIDDIYNGSTYTIDKYGVPELALKGTFKKKTVSTIDYVMRVDLSQMYALALPYDVNLAEITYWDGTAMVAGTDLYISAYDGQARANREKAWVYEEDFESKFGSATLKHGVGYTISAELQSGFGNTYSIIRLPMTNNVAANNTEASKTVAVTAYTNTEGVAITDNHKGWNFVGNPYMVTISGSSAGGADDSKLEIGYLEPTDTDPWDGNYNLRNDGYRYITFPSDDGIEYEQKKWSDATLKPFKNFFIQVKTSGDLSFALASRADAPSHFLQTSEREIEFEITLSNTTRQDHIGLLLAEKYTPAYEINADLEKMENTMSVYTQTEGYKLAYNALSPNDATQPIPIGYIANEAGSYTFNLDENSDVEDIEHIWLTDYDLNRVVDMLDASYGFTTIQGRNETRFALTVELKAEDETPTSIADVIPPDKAAATKFIYKDKMYILNNDIIYDATGKRVNVINK